MELIQSIHDSRVYTILVKPLYQMIKREIEHLLCEYVEDVEVSMSVSQWLPIYRCALSPSEYQDEQLALEMYYYEVIFKYQVPEPHLASLIHHLETMMQRYTHQVTMIPIHHLPYYLLFQYIPHGIDILYLTNREATGILINKETGTYYQEVYIV